METTTRTLIFDDGSETARHLTARARPVSSEVVLVCAAASPNREAIAREIASWGVPVTVHRLAAHEGIRHAIARAAETATMVAFVPDPGAHRGRLLRKCVQAVARASRFQLPALAVHLVRDAPLAAGPVCAVAGPAGDGDVVDLVAVALATSVGAPLRRISVGPAVGHAAPGPDVGERDGAEPASVESDAEPDGAEPASVESGAEPDGAEPGLGGAPDDVVEAISHRRLSTLPPRRVADVDGVVSHVTGARAVVVGLGDLEVSGRRWTAPDELPDSVLETEVGRLVHALADVAPCDVVVVIDSVRVRHGTVATVVLGLVAGTLIGSGVLARGGIVGAAAPFTPTANAVATASERPGSRVSPHAVSPDTVRISNPATDASPAPGEAEESRRARQRRDGRAATPAGTIPVAGLAALEVAFAAVGGEPPGAPDGRSGDRRPDVV